VRRGIIETNNFLLHGGPKHGKTAKNAFQTHEKHGKKQYKVINWPEYNKALVDRGNFTLWISEDVIAKWRHENKDMKVGRPFEYSDKPKRRRTKNRSNTEM